MTDPPMSSYGSVTASTPSPSPTPALATSTKMQQGSSSSSNSNSSRSGISGISQWSPLSTLERQYRTNQLLLFVKINANCCIPGGVEYILKQHATTRTTTSTTCTTNKGSSSSSRSTACTTALSTPGVLVEEATAAAVGQDEGTLNTASATTTSDPGNNDDPFSFLNETRPEGDVPGQGGGIINSNSSSKKSGGPNLGRFLKKVAKSTTAHLERGMHNLAIRADQGRNPDLLAAGLYDENTNTLLSLTESCPLPSDEATRLQGVAFCIPLVVPTTAATTATVTLKLWIRSGAALLQQTKAAKNYLIGAVSLNVQQLVQAVYERSSSSSSSSSNGFAVWNVSLQSNLVVNGQLQLLITNDRKFPALCGRGWSLQDPDPRAYNAAPQCLYNLPLHQAYALSWPQQQQQRLSNRATLVATERTVESTVVLPIATAVAQLASKASQISLQHAQSTLQRVTANRHDKAIGEHALCQVMVGSLLLDHVDTVIANCNGCATAIPTGGNLQYNNAPRPVVQVFFQKPDSIFEVELATPTTLPLMETGTPSSFFQAATSCSFFPKPCRQNILPGILQQQQQGAAAAAPSIGFWLGSVRLQITVPAGFPAPLTAAPPPPAATRVVPQNPFAPTSKTTSSAAAAAAASPQQPQMCTSPQVWECIVPLDPFLAPAGQKQNVPIEYPVMNALGQTVAKVSVVVSLTMEQQQQQKQQGVEQATLHSSLSATGGLVSLMGLRPLTEDILPPMDYDLVASHTADPDRERRRQQLSTMGYFVTHAYLEQHVQTVRSVDAMHWKERAQRYWGALQNAMELPATGETAKGERLPSNEDRTPRAFRPSSSRSEVLLSGIPFNVHTASLSLDLLDPDTQPTTPGSDPVVGAIFHNITCGAPADHARGYSNIFTKKDPNGPVTGLNSPVGPVSGGLRRLEAKRAEITSVVMNLEMTLTMSIANYFMEKRQRVKSRPVHHVPPSTAEIADLRWKLFEAVQSLHHVTWACAMRRSVAFSQALGIAASSFLSSLSDPAKCLSNWPALWTQHGFLVSFEGLLSAAGKELGMIEDASVGISMLSMVKVVIVSDNGLPEGSIPIPNSPYLKWIMLKPSGANPETDFTLQIGMAQSYYDQRIPVALKNGVPVRLYPLLFEVGVDIRQWGAHAGSNMKRNLQEGSANKSAAVESPEPTGGFIDDEDDDVGIPDADVLVQLNSEAYQKLNAYAHAISPVKEKQKTHPMLATLYQHIVSSAGKINHDIVDEAASLAQQLGGGGVVFCKSGKDRTAMHVTYKQAQFANRFRRQQQQPKPQTAENGTDAANTPDTTMADATMMRVYGTRLPICEKNVGQAKYAFNSLQVKFMPEALKPPMHTLAGFLKGGKVFTGGIES